MSPRLGKVKLTKLQIDKLTASVGSTVVEHSPHNPKVKDSSLSITAVTSRNKTSKHSIMKESKVGFIAMSE